MNLETVGLIVTIFGGALGILSVFWKAISRNKAKAKAQQGRIESIVDLLEIQSERTQNIERYLSIPEGERGPFQLEQGLVNLELKALDEYQKHHTNLT